jgi:hypothetical protein
MLKRLFHGILITLFMLIIGMSIWILQSDEDTFRVVPVARNSLIGRLPAAYLVSKKDLDNRTALLSEDEMVRVGVTPVTPDKLVDFLDLNPQVAVLYIDPNVIQSINTIQLRSIYLSGIVLVALNTPHSHLGKLLDVSPTVADDSRLLERANRVNHIAFSIYYTYESRLQGSSLTGQTADIAPNLEELSFISDLYARQLSVAKGNPSVPNRIITSKMSLQEKFYAFFKWVSYGCPVKDC